MSDPMRLCVIDGCLRPQRYTSSGLCRTHYERKRLTGTTDPGPGHYTSPVGTTWVGAGGYVFVKLPDHPLADPKGYAYLHRVRLYDSIGSGEHACHWCRCAVVWGVDLHVDHLDFDRQNNDPANLVPSCNWCNAGRQPPRQRRTPVEHGTRREYHKGCRCDPCRKANTQYEAARRNR